MDENFEGAGLIPISESESKKLVKAQKKHDRLDKEWYSVRSLFGNTDCYFFYLLGARGCGKSFSVLRQFLKDWKTKKRPFTWMRLTEAQTRKLLENKADNFIDAEIKREFDLDITVKGNQLYDKGEFMCRILPLSTYFNSKGVALYDSAYDLGYNICVDEIQRDQGQKNSFGSVGYALVNQLENLVRTTKEKLRIVFIGNYLEDASDVLCMFNFIPETYGRYKLKKKKAIIDYIEPTKKYLRRRKDTVADLLMPEASTFSNKVDYDRTLIFKGALSKPTAIIAFSRNDKFTVWDDRVIKKYNKEKVNNVIAMRPYLDLPFDTQKRDNVFELFNARCFLFRDLITQKKFQGQLELLKPKGR